MRFYNRSKELSTLRAAWDNTDAQLVLLYGRRRIGKTYLLQHFLDDGRPHCYYLAAQTSLSDNAAQLADAVIGCAPQSGLSAQDVPTFRSVLNLIDTLASSRRFALVIDEFQYLLEQDASLPSQIQAWWDTSGVRSNVFLVLCGSHLGMMEGLGGSQAPLFGRFTVRQKLPSMNYADTSCFHSDGSFSTRDKLTTYGVLGGTPRYHALFDPQQSLDDNICRVVLSPSGLLHTEPEVLISSSRVRDPAPYNGVLRAIAGGCTRSNEISQRIGVAPNQLSFYFKTLMEWEWAAKEHPFGERSDARAIYKIGDHFIHFWYRFVSRLRSDLEFSDTDAVYRARVKPHIDQYMGQHVFEDICHQYLRLRGSQLIGQPIRQAGRYWSRDGTVEIDMMGELDDGTPLFGECKWSSSPVGLPAYYDLRDKIAALPQRTSVSDARCIIFSLAGFDDDLVETAKRENLILVCGDDLLRALP